MKKSTMQSLVSFLENVPEMADARAELVRELNRGAEKAAVNRELYESARDAVLTQLELAPDGATLAELMESCEGKLPAGMTKGKVQYALLHYWNDAVSVEQTKGGNVYRLR